MSKLDNLQPAWQQGVSGNPKGRPPGIPNAKTRYKRILELVEKHTNPVTGEIEDFTVAEILDLQQIVKARRGELASYKEIMDRLEGRVQQEAPIQNTVIIPIYGGLSGKPDKVEVRGHNSDSKNLPTQTED